MLLFDVAAASLDMGGTSSRLAAVAHIAEFLRRVTPDPVDGVQRSSRYPGEPALRFARVVRTATTRARPKPAPAIPCAYSTEPARQ